LLLPNHLHQHALRPSSVELAVKDLLPGAEVELAGGDGDDDFAAHDLPLEVGVGVVFAGAVVMSGERPGFRSVVLRTTSLHPRLGSVGLSGHMPYSPIIFTNALVMAQRGIAAAKLCVPRSSPVSAPLGQAQRSRIGGRGPR
jgi:hypothetical protein